MIYAGGCAQLKDILCDFASLYKDLLGVIASGQARLVLFCLFVVRGWTKPITTENVFETAGFFL